jgi:hypothetical protein
MKKLLKKNSPKKRWHYTTGNRLPLILESAVIRPATTGVPAGEHPAAWFSTNRVWEETAIKPYLDYAGHLRLGTRETTALYNGGLVRIEVAPETAPHDWTAFKKLSGITSKAARSLEQAAAEAGASPHQWYVSFAPVPREKWLSIERWDGEAWVPVEQA